MIELSTTRHVDELYNHIENGNKLILSTFVNAFSYYDLSDEMINEIDYFFSDGILLTKLNNFFHSSKVDRISFDSTSLAYPFFNFCADKQLNVALVGATEDEIKNFSQFIKRKFPNINLSFVSTGFINDGNRQQIIEDSLLSDILIAGMGFPLQEEFLLHLKKSHTEFSQLKLAITCGGFFSQHQSNDYYPKLIDKLELRWLYRLVFAKHVRKKVITKYPIFILRYIYNALF
ncbi:hypothetical protein AEA42_08430 [Shewanella sp. Sh95]|uniref:WecB/TagA/CpsF family glycosyltransferase n=1 Tax=Shewanella sp. Sh95 TaxID=1689868 RepID=UPI0006DA6E3F|nr:WecB/TagA/CpsF family glycosyltransferase [Shewanella sp. Sh95]KPN77498.1 hypothetical protein AEA42_08430 [Shewanella sp. Sh95]